MAEPTDRERALDRMTVDYPVVLTRQPDELRGARPPAPPEPRPRS